ncbi:Multimerin-2 [Saguinus oedipus]|uniref:Multimerin-2 n=1 Tax=Saguinus oedipus TaxID=9490 RepID=A0ABQ9UN53_SAGOE|nr:Multimerin-2 [Saguinus oedipus]
MSIPRSWDTIVHAGEGPGRRGYLSGVQDAACDPLPPCVTLMRNWCHYPMSKLVTLLAVCKTEKFLVHSQQPCPQEAPDCQKVKVM